VAGYTAEFEFVAINKVIMRPIPHPSRILGKNKPAGTAVPYVTIVMRNQIKK
jgi:hypothetical protein